MFDDALLMPIGQSFYNFFPLFGLFVQIRPLWRYYFPNTQGLIFVVDSHDRDHVVEARDEFHRMLNEVKLQNQKLLSVFLLHEEASKWHSVFVVDIVSFLTIVAG